MSGYESPSNSAKVEADSEFDRFVYHISHDLRASMRAMTMVPQWIEEDLREEFGEVPASVREHVEILTNQANRLDRMMSDLLVLSRVGRMQTVGNVDLGRALDDVILDLDPPETINLARELNVHSLVAGPKDIRTLFSALLSNAIKHGGQNLHFSSAAVERGVTVRLKDDGPGIAPKHHQRIFEAMTTLKPRDEVEGSGLGLAIARKIMSHYGGTIEVISEGDGQGAEFIATFPE